MEHLLTWDTWGLFLMGYFLIFWGFPAVSQIGQPARLPANLTVLPYWQAVIEVSLLFHVAAAIVGFGLYAFLVHRTLV